MDNQDVIRQEMERVANLQHFADNLDRTYAACLTTKHCLLELQHVNGSPEVEFCGRTATAVCSDCGTVVCDHHAVIHIGTARIMCVGCEALRPSEDEMLEVISDCADCLSPKHYPEVVRRLESILKRAGRPA